jgi:hypothetical protein
MVHLDHQTQIELHDQLTCYTEMELGRKSACSPCPKGGGGGE